MRNMKNSIVCAGAIIAAAALLSSCGSKDSAGQENPSETAAATVFSAVEVQVTAETVAEQSAVEAEAPVTEQTGADKKNTEKLRLETKEEVDVFSKLTVGDLVSASNAMISNADASIDTTALGEHEVNVIYDIGGDIQQTTVKYKVVDREAPVVFNFGSNHIQRGSGFDINDFISYADNYDRAPVATYSGDLDPYTNGEYEIKVTVSDSSGNSSELNIPITVSDGLPVTQTDSGEQTDFAQLLSAQGGSGRLCGIDISTWQNEIDFASVKGAGCEFCIIRVGYNGEEGIVEDEFFTRNIEGAKAAGLKVGVYFYSNAVTIDQAKEHAKWVVDKLAGQKLDMPVAFDWENFEKFQEFGLNLNDLARIAGAFADEIKAGGYDAMLYGSKNFLETFWNSGASSPARTMPVWSASYASADEYQGDHILWQCSGNGRINGIDGAVDLNVWYTDGAAPLVPPEEIPNEQPPTPEETTAEGDIPAQEETAEPVEVIPEQ